MLGTPQPDLILSHSSLQRRSRDGQIPGDPELPQLTLGRTPLRSGPDGGQMAQQSKGPQGLDLVQPQPLGNGGQHPARLLPPLQQPLGGVGGGIQPVRDPQCQAQGAALPRPQAHRQAHHQARVQHRSRLPLQGSGPPASQCPQAAPPQGRLP